MSGGNNYSKFVEAAQKFLRSSKATSPSLTKSMREIVAATRKDFGVEDSTLGQYLNKAATSDNDSGIISLGPHRGYYFNDSALKVASQIEKAEEAAEPRSKVFREASLYIPVKNWLKAEGYQARVTSELRTGRKWSNPDLVGVRVASKYGIRDIEITTVEVKTSIANWRLDVFEAIAHKRFANRVYFAYPVFEGRDKVDESMRRYAELYKIGIIHIFIGESEYKRLHEANRSEDLPVLGDDTIIEEEFPASYEFIPPRYQIEFLDQIGLREEADLFRFSDFDIE